MEKPPGPDSDAGSSCATRLPLSEQRLQTSMEQQQKQYVQQQHLLVQPQHRCRPNMKESVNKVDSKLDQSAVQSRPRPCSIPTEKCPAPSQGLHRVDGKLLVGEAE